jgi:RES domain-containing protein
MSHSIWTLCGGKSSLGELHADAWRVVEDQGIAPTRKLVDSAEEQDLLEKLIDEAKPKPPDGWSGFHYLIWSPFRYAPLKHGSRFGTRAQRSVWYGSDSSKTAFAEKAYYQLLFFEGSKAKLPPVFTVRVCLFTALISTDRGVDLTKGKFADYRAQIAAPTDYSASQQLGAEMRASDVMAFRYPSARDPGGTNVAAFDLGAFGNPNPTLRQDWESVASTGYVEFSHPTSKLTFRFERNQFLVGGKLPSPAL